MFSVAAPRLAAGVTVADTLDRLWSYERIEEISFWIAAAAFAAAVVLLLRQRVGVQRIPTALPVAMLLLLPLYFASAFVCQWGGWTSESATGEVRTIQGPTVIEQPLYAIADSLSGVDVPVSSGGAAVPATGSLRGGDPAGARETISTRTGGGYVRMSFSPIRNSSARVYVLELSIPAGTEVRNVRRRSCRQPPSMAIPAMRVWISGLITKRTGSRSAATFRGRCVDTG